MNSMHCVTQIYQYIKEERFRKRLKYNCYEKKPGVFLQIESKLKNEESSCLDITNRKGKYFEYFQFKAIIACIALISFLQNTYVL